MRTQVHKVTWYMLHYGGATPKRHYCLANSPHVAGLWVDKLRNWKQQLEKLKASGKAKSLVIKYIDKGGKKRWKGSKLLRSSESAAYLRNHWSVASLKISVLESMKRRLWKFIFSWFSNVFESYPMIGNDYLSYILTLLFLMLTSSVRKFAMFDLARSKHDNLEIVSMNNKGPHVFHTTSLLWPRNYPPRFGLRLVDLWHRLSSEKYGMPPLPKEVPPDHVSYSSMSFEDLWSDAHMVSVCHWLRGGMNLNIPQDFRDHLPGKL